MARKVKCRICGNQLEKENAFLKIRIIEKSGNEKKEYYCSESEYNNAEAKKQELNELKSECFTYIHDDVLQLEEGQLIPLSMTKRIGELVKYYPYQVIKASFTLKIKDIQYSLSTKEFNSDHVKGKYVMAIVESVINDVNSMWKRKLENEIRQKNKTENNIDIDTYEYSIKQVRPKQKKKGILEFLKEDEL